MLELLSIIYIRLNYAHKKLSNYYPHYIKISNYSVTIIFSIMLLQFFLLFLLTEDFYHLVYFRRLLWDNDDHDSPPIILADRPEQMKRELPDCRILQKILMLRPGFEPGIFALRGRDA